MVVVGGCVVGAAGAAVLALLSATTSFGVAFVGYVLVGVGWGALVPGIINVAMRDVPPGVSGAASGILNAARQIGTSVGLAVLGTIGVNAAAAGWNDRSAGVQGAAGEAQAVAGGQIAAVSHALGPAYRGDAVASFLMGYHRALFVAVVATLGAAAVAAVGLKSQPADAPVPGVVPGVAPAEAGE